MHIGCTVTLYSFLRAFIPTRQRFDFNEIIARTPWAGCRVRILVSRIAQAHWAQTTGDVAAWTTSPPWLGEGRAKRRFHTGTSQPSSAEFNLGLFAEGRRLSLRDMPPGWTSPFTIHTDLGLRTTSVRVVGFLTSHGLNWFPATSSKSSRVSPLSREPDWEGLLRSPRNRAKLRQWLRETARSDAACSVGGRWPMPLQAVMPMRCFSERDRLAHWRLWRRHARRPVVDDRPGRLSAYAVAAALRGSQVNDVIRSTASLDVRNRLGTGRPTDQGHPLLRALPTAARRRYRRHGPPAAPRCTAANVPTSPEGRASNEFLCRSGPIGSTSHSRPISLRHGAGPQRSAGRLCPKRFRTQMQTLSASSPAPM